MSFREWEQVKLGDVLNFRRGHDLPKKKMKEGPYPVVGSNGIIGYHDEYTTEAPCLTIGRSGSVGNPYIFNQRCWAHNATLYIDDYKDNCPEFIYYLLTTLNLAHYGGGSAVPTLNRNHIHPIEIKIPKLLKEQKSIANILSTLDEKIEVNNQINKTLEEMAQAIFKQWFVDFEFPNENGEPYKSSGGEMVESELGMIPKGWEVRQLGEVCEVKGGKRLPKGKSVQDEKTQYPYIRVTDVNDGNIDVKNIKYIDNETRQAIERYIINYEDVFISIAGTIGLVGTIPKLLDKASLTENMARIVTNELNKYFIKLYLNSKEGQFYITSKQVGSTQPKLPLYAIRGIPVIVADEKTNKKFSTIIDSIFKKVESNLEVSNSLSDIRDSLLPKLMSGEIRVPLND